jgi:AraC-like DNA-binding protein
MIFRSLIVAGIAQSFFLILLLKSKEKNATSDKLLMIWLGIVSFQLLFYYDNLSPDPLAPKPLQLMGFAMPLLSAPVLYFYIHSLSFDHKPHWPTRWGHWLPYLLFCLFGAFVSFSSTEGISFQDGLPHFGADIPRWIQLALPVPLALIPGFYTFLGLRVLIAYQKLLPENYSYTEQINLNWLKWVVLSLLILFVSLFMLIRFGVNLGYVTKQNMFAVVGSVLAFYVFFIGFFGLKQTTFLTDIPVITNIEGTAIPKATYKNSGLSSELVDDLFQKLIRHMTDNKPYLDENLSLTTLAQQVELTTNQLSQVINQETAANFFNFINGYRVEAVKEKLKDPAFAHYSILAIGYECGFQSKSSFNKVFKQLVGKTPLEFQKA